MEKLAKRRREQDCKLLVYSENKSGDCQNTVGIDRFDAVNAGHGGIANFRE